MKKILYITFFCFSYNQNIFAWNIKIYNWTHSKINVRIHRTAAIKKHIIKDISPITETKAPEIYKSGAYCISKVTISGSYGKNTIKNPHNTCYNREVHVWQTAVIDNDDNDDMFEYTTGANPQNLCPVGTTKNRISDLRGIKLPYIKQYTAEFR